MVRYLPTARSTCAEHRGRSKIEKKTPTSSCVRYESHQQSENTPTLQNAEIARRRAPVVIPSTVLARQGHGRRPST